MEKWVLVVGTNCSDPSKEREFSEWYNNTHLPDILEVPGFVRATRYEVPEPGEGESKFIAMYAIETEDIDKTKAALQGQVAKKEEQGRYSDLLVVVSRSYYRQTYP